MWTKTQAGNLWAVEVTLHRHAPGNGTVRAKRGWFGLAGLANGSRRYNPLAPKTPPLPARAKSVIYLFMHGGVSHVDTFDPKPELTRRTGQPLSLELAKTIKTSFIHDPTKAILRGSPWEFQPGGKCGTAGSDLFPHLRDRMPTISASSAAATATRSIMRRPSICATPARSFPDGRAWARGSPTGWARRIRTCRRLW